MNAPNGETLLPRLPIAVTRLRLAVTARDPLILPFFAGSMLRGAFGHALRHLACMTRKPSCEGCSLRAMCPYPRLFEPYGHSVAAVGLPAGSAQPPPPFVLEPPPLGVTRIDVGAEWSFGLRIFGRAARDLPLIVEAWRRALERGLGESRARGELLKVNFLQGVTELSLYDASTATLDRPPEPIGETTVFHRPADVVLNLVTPLRLQSNAQRLRREDLSMRRLVGDALRRARLVVAATGDAQAQALVASWPVVDWLAHADRAVLSADLHWRDWTRRSSRQRQQMTLGGWMGTIAITDASPVIFAALNIGAQLGLGKETVFGMGRYRLCVIAKAISALPYCSSTPIDSTLQN
jgi:hypothetical protein